MSIYSVYTKLEDGMELWISDKVADKIWTKDDRRISRDDVQRAWTAYLKSRTDDDVTIYDLREERDPPPEWILVRVTRKVMKLVFVIFDDDEESAALVTAYYVDRKTERIYEGEGGRIYG